MTSKTLFLLASLCSVCLLTSACSTRSAQTPKCHGYHEQQYKGKEHKKMHGAKSDAKKMKAKMMTNSYNGGMTEMGSIWFKETPDGLQMMADLVYLRPNKAYTVELYQCGACKDDTCCEMEAMSVDLPQLQVSTQGERLKQSYDVQNLTPSQLHNAKIVLTRDGGQKVAWGKLKK